MNFVPGLISFGPGCLVVVGVTVVLVEVVADSAMGAAVVVVESAASVPFPAHAAATKRTAIPSRRMSPAPPGCAEGIRAVPGMR